MGKNAVIVVALLAAGFFAAYLRFRPHLGLEAAYTDGVRTYTSAASEDIRFAVWDTPVPLSSEVNSDARELRPALAPDGRALVFAVGEHGLGADLFIADLEGGEPREARPLLELCTEFDELAPAFSNDALVFATNRPGGAGGLDLWSAPYRDGAFGEPRPLGPSVNTEAEETDPAPLPGGRALAFASDRTGGFDLFLARPEDALGAGTFAVESIAPLVTPYDEREPAFTADGLALFFASDRPGGAGSFDLWRSVLEDGEWLAPESVPGVNTHASERGPLPSRDGFTLLFSVGDESAEDLYRAHSRELFRLPGRPVGWLDLLVLGSLLVLALVAWLAKRWRELEILYKCLVASAAAHVALMLWFQHVGVEGSSTELPGRSALFQVRLAAVSSEPSSALRERGGDVRGTRALEPEVEPLERASIERASAVLGYAADPVESSEPSLEPAPAPTTSMPAQSSHVAFERARVPNPAVALAEHEQAAQRRERAAEPLDVVAQTTALERAESRADAPTSAPRRVALAEDAASSSALGAEAVTDRVRSLSLGEPVPGTDLEAAIGRRSALATGPTRAANLPRVDVAQPNDVAPRKSVGESVARADELPSPSATALPDRAALREGASPSHAPSVATAHAPADAREPGAGAEPAGDGLELPRAEPMAVARSEEGDTGVPQSQRSAEALEPARAAITDVAFSERSDPVHGVASDARETDERFEMQGEPAAPAPQRELEPAAFGLARTPPSLEPTRHRAAVSAAAEAAPLAREVELLRADADAPRVARKLDLSPYRTRFGLEKEHALREHGGSLETEAAVERGLAYLARIQRRGGSFGRADHRAEKYFEVAVGKTGLCLLAFLGAGHTPVSATRYTDVVERAIGYLLSVQDDRSGHFGYSDSYGHGIATYALAECYAITGEERLRAPLERAVAHVLEEQRQDGGRKGGGWGYYYPDGRVFDDWPRVSVTSWQVMALESARLGGLGVPDVAFERARGFLQQSYDDRGWFRYSHDPERLNSGYPTLPGSTPAGLFALSLLGEDVSHERWRDAVSFIVARTPDGYRYTSDDAFVFRAQGNEYFWYYATLALFRHGGSVWDRWNAAMKDTLLGAQDADGSWRPISVYAGYAGDEESDRSYTTALCVLTLEVYYRYFTPLLKVE